MTRLSKARRLPRWQQRAEAGESLALAKLGHDLVQLRYGRQRSHGILALQERYRPFLSRRDLAQLEATERAARELARQQLGKRVQWHEPDVVWGTTDASERGQPGEPETLRAYCVVFMHPLPLCAAGDGRVEGPAIARHLAVLFRRHGGAGVPLAPENTPYRFAFTSSIIAGLQWFHQRDVPCFHPTSPAGFTRPLHCGALSTGGLTPPRG